MRRVQLIVALLALVTALGTAMGRDYAQHPRPLAVALLAAVLPFLLDALFPRLYDSRPVGLAAVLTVIASLAMLTRPARR